MRYNQPKRRAATQTAAEPDSIHESTARGSRSGAGAQTAYHNATSGSDSKRGGSCETARATTVVAIAQESSESGGRCARHGCAHGESCGCFGRKGTELPGEIVAVPGSEAASEGG